MCGVVKNAARLAPRPAPRFPPRFPPQENTAADQNPSVVIV